MAPALTFPDVSASLSIHSNDLQSNGHSASKKPTNPFEGFGTRAIHIGSEPNSETGAVIPAISLSTTYEQQSVGVHKGFEYSRSGNPNRNALEETLASLESGGAYGLAFSSGSATTATVIQSLGPGAHIVSVNDVYGGTFRYMSRVAAENQGLNTTFLDLENATEEEIVASIKDNTKLIWIESPTNPTLRLIDIPRIARIAHSHPSRPVVLVDNTFLSPFYSSPLLLGADIVLHSLTKYINGHSDVVMGALILPPHHAELASKLRFLQNAIGAVPSPYDCWLAQRGAKTLHLRMKQHGVNALQVAKTLEGLDGIQEVVYPGLPGKTVESRRKYDLAWRMLSPHARKFILSLPENQSHSASTSEGTLTPTSESSDSSPSSPTLRSNLTLDGPASIPPPPSGGFPFSGMISFRFISRSFLVADKFLTSTRLFTLAESLGGVESLAEHPARMTHGSIPPKEREILGIGENLIRLSVGVEEVEDLVLDVSRAVEEAIAVRDN